MAVLELDGITLEGRLGAVDVAVLRDISFAVERGATLGLVGESGAGKSMNGRLISGFLPESFRITKGRLLFEGVDLLQRTARQRRALLGRRISFIPQEPLSALNPVMSIGRQFGEHLTRLGIPASERTRFATERLAAVQLPKPGEILQRYPHELSGGQCQRVLIAMAFSGKPSLIVADEPSTALDVITQAHIMRLLKEQQQQHGTAVVFITHDLRLASHICDEVGVMYAGDLVERGPARDVIAEPFHPYTRNLRNSMPSLDGERRALPTMPDQMPGLRDFAGLSGCRFAPRCPTRNAACEAVLPEPAMPAPAHTVRCADACLITGTQAEAEGAALPPRSAEPGARAVIELRDVSLRYTTRRGWFGGRVETTDAVKAVSFAVRAGEFVGLVGESGSGKSSVARLIMGLEQPTGGEILIEEHDLKSAPEAILRLRREHMQMVFQNPQSALNPRRRIYSLVTQALEVQQHHVSQAERLQRAQALLRETGLPPDCLQRVPSQISGGQKQRVNIARALCVTPKLLVADEIVSGLDVSVQAQILNLLLRLGQDLGIGLLLISHDLAVVRYICSRVFVMHRGVVVESGNTEDVFARPQHPYTLALLGAVPPERTGLPWPGPAPVQAFG